MTMMLDVLTVNDIQMLVETEDENARRGNFQRIFPGGEETRYGGMNSEVSISVSTHNFFFFFQKIFQLF